MQGTHYYWEHIVRKFRILKMHLLFQMEKQSEFIRHGQHTYYNFTTLLPHACLLIDVTSRQWIETSSLLKHEVPLTLQIIISDIKSIENEKITCTVYCCFGHIQFVHIISTPFAVYVTCHFCFGHNIHAERQVV